MIRRVLLLSCLLCTATNAFAALGEIESSVQKDTQALSGTVRVQQKASVQSPFSVHIITSNANTIREYVNEDGLVFAVTWRGLTQPNLSVLLGSYFSEYTEADRTRPRQKGQRARALSSQNITIQQFGHMRDVRGLAFIRDKVPSGVDVGELP